MQPIVQIFDITYSAIGWVGTFILIVASVICTGFSLYAIFRFREIKREFGKDVYLAWELAIGIGDRIMRWLWL